MVPPSRRHPRHPRQQQNNIKHQQQSIAAARELGGMGGSGRGGGGGTGMGRDGAVKGGRECWWMWGVAWGNWGEEKVRSTTREGFEGRKFAPTDSKFP